MKTIYNFTNIAAHYRSLLCKKLINTNDFDFHYFYGENNKLNIKEIDFSKTAFQKQKHKLHKLKNYWISGKFLIWQSGVIKRCLKDKIDTVIFVGEFQIISTWLATLICKIRGIKVVYWTHGLYGNESFLKKNLRVLFYSAADNLLLYENRAKRLLIKEGVKEDKLKVIYNSLDYDKHKELRNSLTLKENNIVNYFQNNKLPYLIFVGRLTKIKKIDILIKAVDEINHTNNKVNLLLVGDGEEKQQLITLVKELKLKDYVYFYGACYDETILSKLIYNASLCVSPGNVGLTAIHSLSFGTPVCTHSNYFNQMPEVEVIKEGLNGCFFEENNITSLMHAIQTWFLKEVDRKELKKECYTIVDKYYNPYYQIGVIGDLIK